MRPINLFTVTLLSSLVLFLSCEKKDKLDDASATPTPTADPSPTASPTPTPAAPTPGTAMSFSTVTTTGMIVQWGAATDDVTAQADLLYKVVSSTTNNIADATTAETNGTLVMDWTANTTSTVVTGLTAETTYYFTVLIKDGDGLVAYDTSSQGTLCSGKMIYLANVSNAAFGGKAGADAICNAHKPSGFTGTAKALLYDSSGGRRACSGADCTASSTGQLDWPLAINTTYCNTNYAATMGTTNPFGFLTITLANSLSSSSTYTFTGLSGFFAGSSNNCGDWTLWANPNIGAYGQANATGRDFYSRSDAFCATGGSIYCVEQ